MKPTNDSGQDLYLEPAVEVNREAIDPLGGPLAEVVYNNTCPPGGC